MRNLAVILFWLLGMSVFAQETVLVGDIFSAETGEPIANANIYFQGTQIGTSSNEDGAFMLRAEQSRKRVLVVSALGYHTQRFTIEPGTMAGVQVALKEKTTTLEEVYARPGANPALPLIAGVKAHRKENDRFLNGNAVSATATTDVFLSDIEAKHLKRQMWKSLQAGMITGEDSTLMVPLYTSRQEMRLSGNRADGIGEKTEKEVLKSSIIRELLAQNNGNVDWYQNTIPMLGKSFLSPLASASNTYYNYYLADSVETENGKEYVVHFRTKNSFYATFNGEMRIDSATFALRSVKAEVPALNGINYLRDLRINQQLGEDNSLENEQVTTLLDLAAVNDTSHLFPSLLSRQRLEKSRTLSSRDVTGNDSVRDETAAKMDSLMDVPIVRFATWTAQIINTGYIPTGTCIDIGHIQEILQVNQHEKVHVGLPFRTNERLMKHVSLEASVGYGFRDEAFKGMGRVWVDLPTPRRNVFYLSYHDRYVWAEVDDFSKLLRENGPGWHVMDFTAYAFEALRYNKWAVNTATRQRQIELHFENDWTEHLETQLYARIGWQGYGDPMVGYHEMPSFSYQTLGAIFRVGFKERKIDGYFSRYHVYSNLPVLYFGIEGGSYQTEYIQRYQMFAKLNFMIRQHVGLGMGGTLDYALHVGGIIGAVPYPLLHHFEGNQGYAYDPYRFTLMNNYQCAADKFVAMHVEWNGQGILFNLIPGVRRLRLRELVTFKMAWGTFSEKHDEVLPLATCQSKLGMLHTPYVELGCGIGNILRVLDIHSVWRLTKFDDGSELPYWAMRFRIHISL